MAWHRESKRHSLASKGVKTISENKHPEYVPYPTWNNRFLNKKTTSGNIYSYDGNPITYKERGGSDKVVLVEGKDGEMKEKESPKVVTATMATKHGLIIGTGRNYGEAYQKVVSRYLQSKMAFHRSYVGVKPIKESIRIKTSYHNYYCKACKKRTPHTIDEDSYQRKVSCEKCNRTRIRLKGINVEI